MNNNNALEILGMFDVRCLIKQSELNPEFLKLYLERCEDINDLEFSIAQRNRLGQLARLFSRAFLEEKIDFIVIDILRAFAKETTYRDKDQIRSIFRSFLNVPKCYGSHAEEIFIEKLNGPNKYRKIWGKKPKSIEILERHNLDLEKYLKILEKAGLKTTAKIL